MSDRNEVTEVGILTIDGDAIRSNFAAVAAMVKPADVAAVVKANAYGLGAERMAGLLAKAGCRDFFVAHLSEALALRPQLPPESRLYVLNGAAAGSEAVFADAGIIPVINSIDQARHWISATAMRACRPPAAVQVDSGMARLGLSAADIAELIRVDLVRELNIVLLMSHLACADDPEDPSNEGQRSQFDRLASHFPPARKSLANSSGCFLDRRYHHDLVRVGLALYGAAADHAARPAIRPVVSLSAPVIQIRSISRGQGVGYGLDYRAERQSRIATLGLGYADGWPRSLSNRGAAYHAGARLAIVGAISMDSMSVDVSALPEGSLRPGEQVELIGPHQSLEQVARDAATIPYEILTRLGQRLKRDWRHA
jgi:alanine racemase